MNDSRLQAISLYFPLALTFEKDNTTPRHTPLN